MCSGIALYCSGNDFFLYEGIERAGSRINETAGTEAGKKSLPWIYTVSMETIKFYMEIDSTEFNEI